MRFSVRDLETGLTGETKHVREDSSLEQTRKTMHSIESGESIGVAGEIWITEVADSAIANYLAVSNAPRSCTSRRTTSTHGTGPSPAARVSR